MYFTKFTRKSVFTFWFENHTISTWFFDEIEMISNPILIKMNWIQRGNYFNFFKQSQRFTWIEVSDINDCSVKTEIHYVIGREKIQYGDPNLNDICICICMLYIRLNWVCVNGMKSLIPSFVCETLYVRIRAELNVCIVCWWAREKKTEYETRTKFAYESKPQAQLWIHRHFVRLPIRICVQHLFSILRLASMLSVRDNSKCTWLSVRNATQLY